ncbi:MAG: DNA polymerase III subunit delta' [Chloroflexi bacterium]|nr:DNA polymerase III subunit delta' [Chloroflexota bacterium]
MWNVIGHERVVLALAQSVKDGKLAHAYLFTGPQGIGKMTLAMQLACALNCLADGKPCGACAQCKRILDGKHADVQVVGLGGDGEETQKEISIKQVEALQEMASLAPFEGAHRVFIIENAELLNVNAANRLLKTLEEPPAQVCILLLSREPAKLLPTIVSRCRVYDLRSVPEQAITDALMKLHGTDKERARELARLSEGRIGWALAAAQNPAVEETRRDLVDEAVELIESGYVERLQLAGRMAQDFSRRREESYEALALLRRLWRDALLLKGGSPQAVVNADRRDMLERMTGSLTLAELAGAIRETESAIARLQLNANPRLTLETFALNLPLVKAAEPAPTGRPAAEPEAEQV